MDQLSKSDGLHWAREIERVTTIPDEKVNDIDWLRIACSLAHIYAAAALSPQPSEGQADLLIQGLLPLD